MGRGRRRVVITVLTGVLTGVLAASGCSEATPSPPLSSAPDSGFDFGQIKAAIVLSTTTDQAAAGDLRGIVYLVAEDGTVSAVRTEGIDVAALAWSEIGLAFSDIHHEFLLSEDGLESFDRDVFALQEGSWPITTNGGGVLALYNGGITEDGYLLGGVRLDESGITTADFEGYPDVMGQCGNSIYVVSDAEGRFASRRGNQVFTKIDARTLEQTAIAWMNRTGSVMQAKTAPCNRQRIWSLGFSKRSGYLYSRSIDTGELVARPLTGAGGKPLDLSGNDVGFAEYGQGSISHGEFRWLTADGDVVATDLKSGKTRTLLAHAVEWNAFSRISFEHRHAWILDIPQDLDDPASLRRVELRSGRVTRTFDLPEISISLDDGVFPRDFVIRPASP